VAKDRFDAPKGARARFLPNLRVNPETFGRASEGFARAMGTGGFLIGMTVFVAIWLTWNTLAPASAQFDPRTLNFTLLTLILSMQASYAAPLILLAQNRQDDRDRVKFEQDRQRAERNLADTELEPLKPHTHISVIHRALATYNLVALPVVDDQHHLIGVVTVDDVLDHLLPDDWRTEDESEVTRG
jgi:uncharacterized membrane protein